MLENLHQRLQHEDPGAPVTNERFSMVVSAILEMKQSICELRGRLDESFGLLSDQIDSKNSMLMEVTEMQNAMIEELKASLDSLASSIKTCEHCTNKELVVKVQTNPLVRLGAWIRDSKYANWVITALLIALLIFLSFWTNPYVRLLVFQFLPIPPALLELLTK